MGHLAERYRDASRSGVYRVTDAAVPRAAAQVLLIEGLDTLAAADFQVIVTALERVAAARRESGKPFFAVLLDPGRRLPYLPSTRKNSQLQEGAMSGGGITMRPCASRSSLAQVSR